MTEFELDFKGKATALSTILINTGMTKLLTDADSKASEGGDCLTKI